MKKLIALLLALMLLLSLCACGEKSEPEATAEPAPAATEAPAAETEEPAAEPEETAAPEETAEPATEKTLLELAQECIGKSVEELYALIGEPTGGSDYAPSCLGSGEDGRLYYDGFSVDTYREGDSEEVTVVMPD